MIEQASHKHMKMGLWGDGDRGVQIKNIQAKDCRFCKDGKYIPSKRIDRCAKCLFVKNH